MARKLSSFSFVTPMLPPYHLRVRACASAVNPVQLELRSTVYRAVKLTLASCGYNLIHLNCFNLLKTLTS